MGNVFDVGERAASFQHILYQTHFDVGERVRSLHAVVSTFKTEAYLLAALNLKNVDNKKTLIRKELVAVQKGEAASLMPCIQAANSKGTRRIQMGSGLHPVIHQTNLMEMMELVAVAPMVLVEVVTHLVLVQVCPVLQMFGGLTPRASNSTGKKAASA